MTVLGIDALSDETIAPLKGLRCGLLCNHASVNCDLVHSRFILSATRGINLNCLFSPQHGFAAEKQDNMIESDHAVDGPTGLTVFSLYGDHRRPTAAMFEGIDVLFIDLNDVGTRVYTFIYTMAYCLERAAELGTKVIVLDRPNPIGGVAVEGNLLRADCASFVGLYPLPMRHGMTIAELALLFNDGFGIGADLEVVRMDGWQRSMYFEDTGLPWVFPSPNMPTPTTAKIYPGQVLWEGTNVSEGRGTTLPFELVGAHYWEIDRIARCLAGYELEGCLLRPAMFE
ncbi:MAG: exo-beta-N-acetylmuramidase NamZ family protein, partial [Desulfobulbia bacterium]